MGPQNFYLRLNPGVQFSEVTLCHGRFSQLELGHEKQDSTAAASGPQEDREILHLEENQTECLNPTPSSSYKLTAGSYFF